MRNLKKVLALVLALAMAFSLVASAASFPDVAVNTPTADSVDLLSGLGIIGGYPDGTFGPEKTITRAEFSKMLFVMINGNDNSGLYEGATTNYSDCDANAWYAPYVNWADQLKIVGGYPDGTFKPDKEITIAEAAKMLVTALGFDANDYSFPYGFIDKASTLGIFEDVTGVKADDPALRGNVAIMSYNTLFVDSAPRYGKYQAGNSTVSGWVYETPLEAVFGAIKAETKILGTSTNMPGAANITKNGLVGLAAGLNVAKGAYTYSDVDDLVGHAVSVWFLEDKNNANDRLDSDKYDTIIAVTDETDLTVVATAAQTMVPATGDLDDMRQSDLYTTIDGVNIPLFYAQRNTIGNVQYVSPNDTTNGAPAAAIVKYVGWNDGSDTSKWIVNGGTTDAAFSKLPTPWNKSAMPFTYTASEVFTFIRNDNTDVAERTAPWDTIMVNYWRTGEVKSVNTANIVIDGIANGGAIPANQIKGGIPAVEKGDYVNVTVTTGIVDGAVKNIYTVEKAEVLENVRLEAKGNVNLTINGQKYDFVSRDFVDPNTVMPNDALVGEYYDVVLAKGGFIYSMKGAAGNRAEYMLIKDVAQTVAGFGSTTYTLTGLLSDGTTKTFEVVTGNDGIGADLTVNGTKIFDSAVSTGWVNNSGAAINTADLTSVNASIAAIGQLVEYKTNVDGKISEITGIDNAVNGAAQYKYDKSANALYAKTTGSYALSKFVDASTVLFKYDNKGAGSEYDYSDDVFSVTTMDKVSAFEDTTIDAFTLNEKDATKVDAIFMTGDFNDAFDEDTILCIPTYYYNIEYVDANTMKFGIQVIYNEGSKWVYSNPIDVTKANGNVTAQYNILFKEIYNLDGRTTPPGLNANTATAYMKLDEATGALLKIHGAWTSVKLDITNAQANVTAADTFGAVNSYRAAVLAVTGNIITLGTTTAYGKATVEGTPYTTTVDGATVKRTPRSFDENKKVMFPIADDVKITYVNLAPNATGAAEQTRAGSLSDLNVSTDGGTSYIIDFTVGKDTDRASAPLEITQMLVYQWAVSNYDDVAIGAGTSAPMIEKAYGSYITPSGTGTLADPYTASVSTSANSFSDANLTLLNATSAVVNGTSFTGANETIDLTGATTAKKAYVTVANADGEKTYYVITIDIPTTTTPLVLNATAAELASGKDITADILGNINKGTAWDNANGGWVRTAGRDTSTSNGHTATLKRVAGNVTTIKSTNAAGGDTFTFSIDVYDHLSKAKTTTMDITVNVTTTIENLNLTVSAADLAAGKVITDDVMGKISWGVDGTNKGWVVNSGFRTAQTSSTSAHTATITRAAANATTVKSTDAAAGDVFTFVLDVYANLSATATGTMTVTVTVA